MRLSSGWIPLAPLEEAVVLVLRLLRESGSDVRRNGASWQFHRALTSPTARLLARAYRSIPAMPSCPKSAPINTPSMCASRNTLGQFQNGGRAASRTQHSIPHGALCAL